MGLFFYFKKDVESLLSFVQLRLALVKLQVDTQIQKFKHRTPLIDQIYEHSASIVPL